MDNEQAFYNSNVKEKYLESVSDSVGKFCTQIFKKCKVIEEKCNKDLYDMDLKDISEVMIEFKCSSTNAVYQNLFKMEGYINWAIQNEITKTNTNPLAKGLNKNTWGQQFVVVDKNCYFSLNEILELKDQLVNVSDQAVLLAIFEGIEGKGYSELINIKVSDIFPRDGLQFVKLVNEKKEVRLLQISDLLAKTLLDAASQTVYFDKNGKSTGRAKTSEFVTSTNIIKNTRRGKGGEETVFHFINRKLILFKEVFGIEGLKSSHIRESGIMHQATLMQKEGILTTNDLQSLAEKYDGYYTRGGNRLYRHTTKIKSLVTSEIFQDIYGYKMKIESAEIDNKFFRELPNQLDEKNKEKIATSFIEEIEKGDLSETEKEALIKMRIGQSTFRKKLLAISKHCRLCAISDVKFLIASHIKPWSESTNSEKLNVNNGLLLCPNHDALFDKGLISFQDNGQIIISNNINENTKTFLNVNEKMVINIENGEQLFFLKWHRENRYYSL